MELGDKAVAVARHALQHKILIVEGLTGKKELRSAPVEPSSYLEVKVRCPDPCGIEGVRPGLDRCEAKPSLAIGQLNTVALKVRIEWRWVHIRRVRVATERVRLPELNLRPTYRIALLVHDPTTHLNNLPLGSPSVASNAGQIGVTVGWFDHRIERAGRRRRCGGNRLIGPPPQEAPW